MASSLQSICSFAGKNTKKRTLPNGVHPFEVDIESIDLFSDTFDPPESDEDQNVPIEQWLSICLELKFTKYINDFIKGINFSAYFGKHTAMYKYQYCLYFTSGTHLLLWKTDDVFHLPTIELPRSDSKTMIEFFESFFDSLGLSFIDMIHNYKETQKSVLYIKKYKGSYRNRWGYQDIYEDISNNTTFYMHFELNNQIDVQNAKWIPMSEIKRQTILTANKKTRSQRTMKFPFLTYCEDLYRIYNMLKSTIHDTEKIKYINTFFSSNTKIIK
jgi:hypothetical protein